MDSEELVPASEGICVRERLHRIIDDLEMIMKQLGEIVTIPRDERGMAKDMNAVELTRLFKIKEEELEKTLRIAAQQAERQKVIEQLELEVQKRDDYLLKIQICLRDAERLMTNAIFQANQKLKSIAQANHQKVSAEELIRYAHRISASNAIAAPMTWQQGDPQRPFPTDVEMRSGLLGRVGGTGGIGDPLMMAQQQHSVPSTPPMMMAASSVGAGAGFVPPGMPPPAASSALHHQHMVSPDMTLFSPHHRPQAPPPFANNPSPSAVFSQQGGIMPPRNVMVPAGWVAQRALTPPNVSPRSIRLPPPPPPPAFHPGGAGPGGPGPGGMQQHATPPSVGSGGGHYAGGPVSPASSVTSPLSAMHSMQMQQQQQQHPLMNAAAAAAGGGSAATKVSPQLIAQMQYQQQQQMAQAAGRGVGVGGRQGLSPARMLVKEEPTINIMLPQQQQQQQHPSDTTVELLSSDSSSNSSSDSPD